MEPSKAGWGSPTQNVSWYLRSAQISADLEQAGRIYRDGCFQGLIAAGFPVRLNRSEEAEALASEAEDVTVEAEEARRVEVNAPARALAQFELEGWKRLARLKCSPADRFAAAGAEMTAGPKRTSLLALLTVSLRCLASTWH